MTRINGRGAVAIEPTKCGAHGAIHGALTQGLDQYAEVGDDRRAALQKEIDVIGDIETDEQLVADGKDGGGKGEQSGDEEQRPGDGGALIAPGARG